LFFIKYLLFRPDYFRLTLFFQLLLFRLTMSFIVGGFLQYLKDMDNSRLSCGYCAMKNKKEKEI